jgi:hypothetical protein
LAISLLSIGFVVRWKQGIKSWVCFLWNTNLTDEGYVQEYRHAQGDKSRQREHTTMKSDMPRNFAANRIRENAVAAWVE